MAEPALSAAGAIWPSIGIAIGWYVVHRFALARERARFRKDSIAKEITDLCASASSILEKAVAYHCAERDTVKERDLNHSLRRIALRIEYLPRNKDILEYNDALNAAIAYKQAITGIHFEDEHTSSLKPDDTVIAEIQLAAYNLETELLKVRSKTFQ